MANFGGMKKLSDECEEQNSAKKMKIEKKLARSEGRLFHEKIVFLNKSTTKYAAIGVHPTTFKPLMRICDRSTGSFFAVKNDEYCEFIHRIERLLTDEPSGILSTSSNIRIEVLSENVWKFDSDEGNGAAVHRITLENLLQLEGCIYTELEQREHWGLECQKVIEKLRFETVDLTEREIMVYLNTRRLDAVFCSITYQVVFDLMCNRSYLLSLEEFNEGFYKRRITL